MRVALTIIDRSGPIKDSSNDWLTMVSFVVTFWICVVDDTGIYEDFETWLKHFCSKKCQRTVAFASFWSPEKYRYLKFDSVLKNTWWYGTFNLYEISHVVTNFWREVTYFVISVRDGPFSLGYRMSYNKSAWEGFSCFIKRISELRVDQFYQRFVYRDFFFVPEQSRCSLNFSRTRKEGFSKDIIPFNLAVLFFGTSSR